MKKRHDYLTLSLVFVLFIIIVREFYLDFVDRNSVSLDDILAFLLLIFGVRLIFTRLKTGQYIVLFLILLSLGGLITGFIILDDSHYSSGRSSVQIGTLLSFNPFAFLLLIFYCLINREGLKNTFRGSENERGEAVQKKIHFYYNMFNSVTKNEFDEAFRKLDEYPEEAKVALNRIRNEHESKRLDVD